MTRRFPFSIRSVVAAVVGLGTTWMTTTKGTELGTLTIGAWTARPRTGTADVDPYSRATIVRNGELPIGTGDGVAFTTAVDDNKKPLDGRCDVAVAGELAARDVEVVQVEIDERRFARAAELAIDLAEPAQPVVVLVVDDVGLPDQLAVVTLGLGPPALLDQCLRLIRGRLDRVERPARHQRTTFILRLTAGSVAGGSFIHLGK